MNLASLRKEVLDHGFDPLQYATRINQYINDCNFQIASQVSYYTDEKTMAINTVAGQDTYPWPTDLADIRSIFDTTRFVEMTYVSLREIDRSNTVTRGQPAYWAYTGPNIRFYPVPDGVYPLMLRYWALPPLLVNDPDTPPLPVQWHPVFWIYATWQCYEADDDAQMGEYWGKRYANLLSELKADLKFPTSDGPIAAKGMWDQNSSLGSSHAWGYYG